MNRARCTREDYLSAVWSCVAKQQPPKSRKIIEMKIFEKKQRGNMATGLSTDLIRAPSPDLPAGTSIFSRTYQHWEVAFHK